MVAPLITGLAKTVASQVAKKGVKKIAIKKVRSNKKIPKKSKLISSKENKIEKNPSILKDSGEKTKLTLTGSSKKLTIEEASSSKSQVEQLKINVTNIHSFLVSRNKNQKRLKEKNKRLVVKRIEKEKLNKEEKTLQSPVGKSLDKIKDSVASAPGMSLLDRLINFGSLILAGILVNALPGIIQEVKKFFDNLVSFVTPIYSGFVLLKALIDGEPLDNPELNPEKKRMSDQVKKLKKEVDKIKKNFGPLGFVITPFQKLVDTVFKFFRGDKIVLATKTEIDIETGEKKIIEGFKDLETDTFIPRRFTEAEKTAFDEQREKNLRKDPNSSDTTNLNIDPSSYNKFASGVSLDPGQPGVDFTPAGSNNRAVFDGKVVEIGHQYNPNSIGGDGRQGSGYGNYVVIRSEDPKKQGKLFDGLYAHFPDGEIVVKVGDKVKIGDVLGRMATAAEYANPTTRRRVGSGTGPHTSLDFLVPNTNTAYPDYRSLVPLIKPYNEGSGKISPPSSEGGGNLEKIRQIQTINQRDPRRRGGSTVIAVQRVNTIQTVPYMMPIPVKSKSFSSTSSSTLSSIWSS